PADHPTQPEAPRVLRGAQEGRGLHAWRRLPWCRTRRPWRSWRWRADWLRFGARRRTQRPKLQREGPRAASLGRPADRGGSSAGPREALGGGAIGGTQPLRGSVGEHGFSLGDAIGSVRDARGILRGQGTIVDDVRRRD